MTIDAELLRGRVRGRADADRLNFADDDQAVSVAEAAALLGRDRTRVYALLRSGDLVAAPDDEDGAGPVRVLRASLERWLAAGGTGGAPLSSRNAWALIGLASATSRSRSAASVCSSARKRSPAHERGSHARKAWSSSRRGCAGARR